MFDDEDETPSPPQPPICRNCQGTHYGWQCPEIRAALFAPALLSTDRIIASVLDRIAHPHPCSSCGDLTAADICASCQEWELSTYPFAVAI